MPTEQFTACPQTGCPPPGRLCPGSVRSPSCSTRVPAPCRVLASAPSALIPGVPLPGTHGGPRVCRALLQGLSINQSLRCQLTIAFPEERHLQRGEGPARAPAPSRKRGFTARLLLLAKGLRSGSLPPLQRPQGISAVRGLGLLIYRNHLMLNRKSAPHSSVEASSHTLQSRERRRLWLPVSTTLHKQW